ncbi:MAG: ester cyclase [Pseudomonadota bacterium]
MSVDTLDSTTLQEANKALVRSYHERLWGTGDLSVIGEVWSPDAKVSMTDFDGTALDTVVEDAQRYFGAFNDVSTTIHDLLAEGDKVVLHWSTVGTHVGPYGEVQPTGKQITMAGMDILTIKNGKIVEIASMWDGMTVYDQLGVLKIG